MEYIYIFGIFALAVIIRIEMKTNASTKLLKEMYKTQNREFLLLRKIVEKKLNVNITEEFYYQTEALDKIKECSVDELFLQDGSLNNSLVEMLAILYQQHCKELETRDCLIEESIAMFNIHIDDMVKELSDEKRSIFLVRYQIERMVFRG